jgi:metal-responsive CopG/Arc/MetJ family transcriptional regulator
MQAMSLKVEDEILQDAEHFVKRRKISRNAYINEAIKAYNALERRRELREKLAFESKLVAADSLSILKELEQIGDGNLR